MSIETSGKHISRCCNQIVKSFYKLEKSLSRIYLKLETLGPLL